uniref:Uncharacterized protein n=2 Tax=Brassica TaxID=3705 RepID=M4F296_BRACM
MQRAAEYTEIMTAAGLPHNTPEHLMHHQLPRHPVIQISVNGVVRNYFFAALPRIPTRAMAIVPSWTPS